MDNSGKVLRFRRELRDLPVAPHWPDGTRLVDLAAGDAAEVHNLLCVGYANGGGTVSGFEPWWDSLRTDLEFDPTLCFVVRQGAGPLVGVAQCWTSAFVKDLVVHPNWRRRGLGEALLLHVFATFRQRGAIAVDLKVRENNSGAISLYRRVGMQIVM